MTLFAGLATGIGSALAFFTKQTNVKFLSVALGLAAGVMIYVSFMEIFTKGQESLISIFNEREGTFWTIVAFFGGMLLIGIIDRLVPTIGNPHTVYKVEDLDETHNKSGLVRMGILTAIAIHNIPEGIAVSIPVYYGTGDKKKAFLYSFLSGLSEPLGGLVTFLLLGRFFNELAFGLTFGLVAGIMVFISLDQLLPTSGKYGEHHFSIYGLVAGMMVMAASLLLFI